MYSFNQLSSVITIQFMTEYMLQSILHIRETYFRGSRLWSSSTGHWVSAYLDLVAYCELLR